MEIGISWNLIRGEMEIQAKFHGSGAVELLIHRVPVM